MCNDENDVDVAQHEGDIRIYDVEDTEIWIQSDVSVDEVLENTDSDATYPTNKEGHHPDGDDS